MVKCSVSSSSPFASSTLTLPPSDVAKVAGREPEGISPLVDGVVNVTNSSSSSSSSSLESLSYSNSSSNSESESCLSSKTSSGSLRNDNCQSISDIFATRFLRPFSISSSATSSRVVNSMTWGSDWTASINLVSAV